MKRYLIKWTLQCLDADRKPYRTNGVKTYIAANQAEANQQARADLMRFWRQVENVTDIRIETSVEVEEVRVGQ